MNDSFKNTGKRVINTRSNKIGVILREMSSGSIQVLESIEPYVINTHDSWNILKVLEEVE